MLLALKNLSLTLDGKELFKSLNLSIGEKEVYCLVGMNGAGKTTLANAIMGLVRQAKGGILFKGKDITKLGVTERAKRGITIAWQKPVSIEGVTVKEYVKLGNKGLSDKDVGSILESVGMSYGEYAERLLDDKLSGGERKRIELASVLGMNAELVILDEPDSGIDIVNLQFIKKIIKQLKDDGKSVLLITHKDEMVLLADRAGIMCAGKIVHEGMPGMINEHFGKGCLMCRRGAE